MTRLAGFVYQAPPEFAHHLQTELQKAPTAPTRLGPLFFVPGEQTPTHWHQNVWLEPWEIPFSSLSDAAEKLRSLGAFWAPCPSAHFRKAALIQEKLPRVPTKRRAFPFALPTVPMGAWTLKDETTLWASPVCTSPFANGEIPLEENKLDPPSSAYLKLQEALTLYPGLPQKGEVCLDAGSSPGGWSWVLAQTGALVHSVDRAPLDDRLSQWENLRFRRGNAFALRPEEFAPLDWFFSDVICYPAKLWAWLEPWITSGAAKHFVVTVKMQGKDCDWDTLKQFASVPGSRLVHLFHNKHELTWML